MARRFQRTLLSGLVILAVSAAGTAAQAADKKTPPAPTASASDRLVCQRDRPSEDLEACVKEQGAARAAERSGELATPGGYVANRARRCDVLRGDDHADCLARMRGEGTVSGSVEGGGLLRELVTEVPARR